MSKRCTLRLLVVPSWGIKQTAPIWLGTASHNLNPPGTSVPAWAVVSEFFSETTLTSLQRLARCTLPITNRPLATAPNKSYRLKGAFGWIMIGAMDDQAAMIEARRSTDHPRFEDLQRWDGQQYVNCTPAAGGLTS